MSAYAYDESLTVEPVSKYDFIPAVYIDSNYHTVDEKNEKGYDIKEIDKPYCLSKYHEKLNKKQCIVEIDKKKGETELILRFDVTQGNSNAEDRDGTINAKSTGVEVLSKATLEVKYGWKILLKISTENIAKDARIEFYSKDSGFWDRQGEVTEEILCGILNFGYKQTCFCNRDFTVEELTEIILNLRKNTYESKLSIFHYHSDKLFYKNSGCSTNKDYKSEIVPQEQQNFEYFTKVLNKCFKDFKIDTCIKRISFIILLYQAKCL